MKTPIDVSDTTGDSVMITDVENINSVGYLKCRDTTRCTRPYHYMIMFKNGQQVEIDKERFAKLIIVMGISDYIQMPEQVGTTSLGVN